MRLPLPSKGRIYRRGARCILAVKVVFNVVHSLPKKNRVCVCVCVENGAKGLPRVFRDTIQRN